MKVTCRHGWLIATQGVSSVLSLLDNQIQIISLKRERDKIAAQLSGKVIQHFGERNHQYADNNRFYTSTRNVGDAIDILTPHLEAIRFGMGQNKQRMIPRKADAQLCPATVGRQGGLLAGSRRNQQASQSFKENMFILLQPKIKYKTKEKKERKNRLTNSQH